MSQVRLVFDAHPNDVPLPLPLPLDSESGTTTLDDLGALLQDNPLEAVLEVLDEVAEDKQAEIQQICRWVRMGGVQGCHFVAAWSAGGRAGKFGIGTCKCAGIMAASWAVAG
jgi:hypothetical protein